MIYVFMKGRIGNQLFIHAAAEELRKRRGWNETIVVDDTEVLAQNWENSLPRYPLEGVEYVHDRSMLKSWKHPALAVQYFLLRLYRKLAVPLDRNRRFALEKKLNRLFNRLGIITVENGFLAYRVPGTKHVLLDGYFQSEAYFPSVGPELRETFGVSGALEASGYPGLEQLRSRNSVCISIKVEHNVGSSIYDVCGHGYWEQAIRYVTERVENPLFFICSDNVDYVKEHLIDCTKFDCISQDKTMPVHLSLAAMAQCRHFIIGNTTFGWWAQYLSREDPAETIVVAPSRWMAIDMPIHLYQSHWHLEEV